MSAQVVPLSADTGVIRQCPFLEDAAEEEEYYPLYEPGFDDERDFATTTPDRPLCTSRYRSSDQLGKDVDKIRTDCLRSISLMSRLPFLETL